jgi:AcrR family transcriptional regulator
MVESLRDKQKQVARELMLQAAADLIVEGGLESLSLAEVADRAGVSKRTLYNYFDSREALLVDLGRWSDELTVRLGGYLRPQSLDALPEMVPAVWRTWAAQGTVHQAVLKIAAATTDDGISEDRRQRRAALATAVARVRPDLPVATVDQLAAVFHAIASGPVFERLTAQDGLDVDAAGALMGWVITLMRDALEDHTDPRLPSPSSSE